MHIACQRPIPQAVAHCLPTANTATPSRCQASAGERRGRHPQEGAWQDGRENVEDDGELGVVVVKGGGEVVSLEQHPRVAGGGDIGDASRRCAGIERCMPTGDGARQKEHHMRAQCVVIEQSRPVGHRSSQPAGAPDARAVLGSSGAGWQEIDRAGRSCKCCAGIKRSGSVGD